jgi:flagellar biosynthesis GTPase FlhF
MASPSVAVAGALLLAAVATTGQPHCDTAGDAATLRRRAAELYQSGEWTLADSCVSSALVTMTGELEMLATQAEALRRFRDARRASPTSAPAISGCIVDASGSSVCLPELKTSVTTQHLPQNVEECGSEQSAILLLEQQQQQQQALEPPATRGGADAGAEPGGDGAVDGGGGSSSISISSATASSSSFYDTYIVQAARRLWWTAAKRAVDELRNQNVPPSSETRRALTELRDESGSLLALMRQTKLDEATISCAVMWAQGERSIHLNVKFAGRLDAPVTVLNVDNEEVHMNATHVSFSGVGRQKPKRYVMNIELFEQIDPERSSWAFGSVGTVRFVLRKAVDGSWARLTKSNETVKHHRQWWEKQEQVEKEDRKQKETEANTAREKKAAEEAEERAVEQAAVKQKAAAELAEKQAEIHAQRVARRLEQKPTLDAALAAFDTFATAPKEQLDATMVAAQDAAMELLKIVGQEGNETASANAQQRLNALKTLRATGFADLTTDVANGLSQKYKSWLTNLIEPEVEALPSKKAKKKAKPKAKPKAGMADSA